MGSGTILREVLRCGRPAEEGLRDSDRCLVGNEFQRTAPRRARGGALEPAASGPGAAQSYIEQAVGDRPGPYVAATDYMKIVPDQIERWVPGQFLSPGYGRLWPLRWSRSTCASTSKWTGGYIAITTLKALADDGASLISKSVAVTRSRLTASIRIVRIR